MKRSVVLALAACTIMFCESSNPTSSSKPKPTATGSYLCWTGSGDSLRVFKLLRMNGTTGGVSVIGGDGFFTQLVYGPDGTLYGIGSSLCRVNTQTGATTLIGDLILSGSSSILMAGAEFSPAGVLYVLQNGSDTIYTVNLGTGALTFAGKSSVSMRDFAFNNQGTMYAGSSTLVILNASTFATQSTIGSREYQGGPMFFNSAGALLEGDVYPSTQLFSINLQNGVATSLLTVGSPGIRAIVQEKTSLAKAQSSDEGPAWTPSRDYLIRLEQAYKNGVSRIDF